MQDLVQYLNLKINLKNRKKSFQELRQNNIFIFSNGNLENNYPRKYQKEKSKSANALYASQMITEKDFNSSTMKNLREIIKSI